MFFRRIDDDRGKSYELGQCSVKCMRGILECWIKQSSRIELFKSNQCNKHALHCKFNMQTGNEVYSDDEYSHLQVNLYYALLYIKTVLSEVCSVSMYRVLTVLVCCWLMVGRGGTDNPN